jgi:predicted GH43/DUF377 family glycosyl hydrolase
MSRYYAIFIVILLLVILAASIPSNRRSSLQFSWNFVKYSENPIITTGSDYDIHMVDTPSVPVWDEVTQQWFIYYGGNNLNDKWAICLATSSDGICWLKYENNPIIDIAPIGENTGASDVSVVKDENKWKMWFTYRANTNTTWQLGMATSNDGKSWNLSTNNPLFKWNGDIYEPFVIEAESEYRLYYSSHEGIEFATSSDGVNWINKGTIYDPGSDQFGPFPFKPSQSNYWYLFYGYHAKHG